MSWIQLFGETWPVTDEQATLRLHLWEPLCQCPRRSWSWGLRQYGFDRDAPLAERKLDRWLQMEIGDLHFRAPDWRRFAGYEIRADAAWHETAEYFGEYGHLHTSELGVHLTDRRPRLADPAAEAVTRHWKAHDFLLRFGARDGLGFACELEAWLLPEEDYHRTTPETPSELARFGEGPPDLRIVTQAVFTRGMLNLPRTDDPLPLARQYLREEAACEDFHQPEVRWALRRKLDNKTTERLPGWTSTVNFHTRPLL